MVVAVSAADLQDILAPFPHCSAQKALCAGPTHQQRGQLKWPQLRLQQHLAALLVLVLMTDRAD